MFVHLRYFSFIIFILVVAIAFAIGFYFHSVASKGVIQAPSEHAAKMLGESFSNVLWKRYQGVFESLSKKDVRDWSQNKSFVQFQKEARWFFSAIPALKLSLLTPSGDPFFSTNKSRIISERVADMSAALSQARLGTISSLVIPNAGISGSEPGVVDTNVVMVKTFVPIKDSQGNVKVIIDLAQDASVTWTYLDEFQYILIAVIVAICTVMYAIMFFMSRHAGSIINKQHETNLELAAAKARAETENREKSKFLANISHELRTPLNAIIGFSEILKDESMGPIENEQYKDYIRDINASGVHLLSLINDILDYSKAEANKLDVEFVDVNVTKTVISSIRLVGPRAEEAGVELIQKLPNEHLILKADPKRFKQVLLNLLSNAVKFTPEGGKVTVMVTKNTDVIAIEVTDTGIGIAAKDIAKAMATFGQVDSKLSRRYEGTGLGLPLTKKLVELMNGAFDIKSELGLGTTITLLFPLKQSEDTEETNTDDMEA